MSIRLLVRRFAILLPAALVFTVGMPLYGDDFVVTSLADSGPGTLRQKLDEARNAPVWSRRIIFAVSGVINLLSPLDIHIANTLIDGDHRITLDGGGAVQIATVQGNSLILYRLSFANGRATYGGALAVFGTEGNVIVRKSAFTNNVATGRGGAISVGSEMMFDVAECSFEGNRAEVEGGAIWNGRFSWTGIVNSTFHNNRAATGGAIGNQGKLHLNFSTIAGNDATLGGGVVNEGGGMSSADFSNTIVANNAGGNCAGEIVKCFIDGYGNPRCVGDSGGNISYPDNTCPGVVADPRLGPFAFNGGPTKTMALLAGSPAIDAAVGCNIGDYRPVSDQRGVLRPQGPACDAGAYEKSPITFSGFFAPISNPPLINEVKAGQTVPIQFGAGSYLGMGIIAPGYPKSQPVSCETALPGGELVSIDTPGASGLSYDNFANTYSINWKTEKTWANTCRQVVLRLTDGVDHVARFRFR